MPRGSSPAVPWLPSSAVREPPRLSSQPSQTQVRDGIQESPFPRTSRRRASSTKAEKSETRQAAWPGLAHDRGASRRVGGSISSRAYHETGVSDTRRRCFAPRSIHGECRTHERSRSTAHVPIAAPQRHVKPFLPSPCQSIQSCARLLRPS